MCSKEGQWIIVFIIDLIRYFFYIYFLLFFVYTAFRYQLLVKTETFFMG